MKPDTNQLLPAEDDTYTVTRLNREVHDLLKKGFPLSIRLQGEISNLVRPASNHLYFSLKDRHTQVRAVMFSGMNRRLTFSPESGVEVIVRAKIGLYEGRGEFQLIVEHMESVGAGDRQRAYEELKQKLFHEGLFDKSRKRPLPKFPAMIGILSSTTGAAVHDVLSALERRYPIGQVIIYPIPVQGENAALQITDMLRCAIDRNECEVLVIARGGGAIEDLWAFNDEILARAIADCPIPVVTGIGHEIDFTIADFVADVRAPTPSVAGELISPDCEQLKRVTLEHHKHNLSIFYNATQVILEERVLQLRKRMPHPQTKVHNDMQRLDSLTIRLQQKITGYQNNLRARLRTTAHVLRTISPLATLERGYAIVSKQDGAIVRTAGQCHVGDPVQVRLHAGNITCTVDEVIETDQSISKK